MLVEFLGRYSKKSFEDPSWIFPNLDELSKFCIFLFPNKIQIIFTSIREKIFLEVP